MVNDCYNDFELIMRCEIVLTVMMMVLMASGINRIFGRTTVGISRIPQYPKNRFITPDALAFG